MAASGPIAAQGAAAVSPGVSVDVIVNVNNMSAGSGGVGSVNGGLKYCKYSDFQKIVYRFWNDSSHVGFEN